MPDRYFGFAKMPRNFLNTFANNLDNYSLYIFRKYFFRKIEAAMCSDSSLEGTDRFMRL